MSQKGNKIHQIITHLTGAACIAVDGVTETVQNATAAVGEKYDVIKLTIELKQLYAEQTDVFTEIGHTLFLVEQDDFSAPVEHTEEAIDTQQTIDRLLLLAANIQTEIDAITLQIETLSGNVFCPVCDKACDAHDTFCAACGAKLHQYKG